MDPVKVSRSMLVIAVVVLLETTPLTLLRLKWEPTRLPIRQLKGQTQFQLRGPLLYPIRRHQQSLLMGLIRTESSPVLASRLSIQELRLSTNVLDPSRLRAQSQDQVVLLL